MDRAPTLPVGFQGLRAGDVERLGRGDALVFDGALGGAAAREVALALARTDDALVPGRLARAAERARRGESTPTEARTLESAVRGDRVAWPERGCDPALAVLWSLFDRVALALRAEAWLGPLEIDVQHAVYPAGSPGYLRHRDAQEGGGRRRATAVWYANPRWTRGDGGELRVFEAGGARDVAPELDRLVLFLAERLEHAVLPCAAPRRAVTAWFLGPRPI